MLIIEYNEAMRSAMSALLLRRYESARLLHAGDGAGALALATEMQPGVVLLSIGLPDAGTDDLLPRLRAAAPAAIIIVVSYQCPALYRTWALAAGADGFVQKDRVFQELVPAIESARAVRTAPVSESN